MAKGTKTLKEARDIIEEMNLSMDRFNQGLKDSDGFTKKMTRNIAEQLEGLDASRKSNKMNGKQLGAVADLGKEILDGNIDVAKSKRMQESLQAKLNKKMSAGQRSSIENQLSLLRMRDKAEKVQNKVNVAQEIGDKLTGGMASKAGGFFKHMKKVGPVAGGVMLIIGLIYKSLKFVSDITDALGKQFGVMGTAGGEFQKNMQQASVDVISLGKGTTDVVTLVNTLSKDFGITLDRASKLPEQILDTAVAIGLTTDEASKLFGTLMVMGDLTADQAESLAESTYQLAQQNQVNPSAVMKDIADNAELIAKYGAENADSLAKAAVRARQLGLNLQTVDKISESLLDFQSSLNAEIEASIMVGKRLNFQKARELALTGDTSAMMEEVISQLGDESDMILDNVLARKALAASVNIEVKEMEKLLKAQDKSVVQQKQFADLAGKDGMSALTAITNQIKELGAQFLVKFGQPLEQALEKFKDEFFTDENIEKVTNFIHNFAESVVTIAKGVASIFNFFTGLANLFSLNNLLITAMTAAGYAFGGPLGGAAAGLITAGLTPDDGTGVNDFRSGGGSHLIITPTGKMLKTNPNDTIMGSTKVNDFVSGNEGSMPLGADMSSTNSKLDKLNESVESLIELQKRQPQRHASALGVR